MSPVTQHDWKVWQAAVQWAALSANDGEFVASDLKAAFMEGQRSATGRKGTEFRWIHSETRRKAESHPAPPSVAVLGGWTIERGPEKNGFGTFCGDYLRISPPEGGPPGALIDMDKLCGDLSHGTHLLRDLAVSLLTAAPSPDHIADAGKMIPAHEGVPKMGVPVVGYNPAWIDPDFNDRGYRECFTYGDATVPGGEWHTAKWVDGADQYETTDEAATHWFHMVPASSKASSATALATAEARIAELEKALEPFAMTEAQIDAMQDCHGVVEAPHHASDHRRAAALLKGKE
jgi:hypothetical protein